MEHNTERRMLMDSFKACHSGISGAWGKRGTVGSTSIEGQNYVQSIERILLHGLKLGMKVRNIQLTLVYVINLVDKDIQGLLQKLPKNLSVYAVERAWIRFRLNTGAIGDCVSKLDTSATKALYHDWAFMQSPEECSLFASMLKEATSNVAFDMGLEDPTGFVVQTSLTQDGSSGASSVQPVHVQPQKRKKHRPKDGEKAHTGKGQKSGPSKPRTRRVVIESGSIEEDDDVKSTSLKREGSLPHLVKNNESRFIGKGDLPTPEGLPFDTAASPDPERMSQGRSPARSISPRNTNITSHKSPANTNIAYNTSPANTNFTAQTQKKQAWGGQAARKSNPVNPFEDSNEVSTSYSQSTNPFESETNAVNETNPFEDGNSRSFSSNQPTNPFESESSEHSCRRRESLRSMGSGKSNDHFSLSANPFEDDNEGTLVYKPKSRERSRRQSIKSIDGEYENAQPTNPFEDNEGSVSTEGYSSYSGSYSGSKRSSRIVKEEIRPSKSTNPFEEDEDSMGTSLPTEKPEETNPFNDNASFSSNPFADELSSPIGMSFSVSANQKIQPKREVSNRDSGHISVNYSPKEYGSQSFTRSSSSAHFDEDAGYTRRREDRGYNATNPFESEVGNGSAKSYSSKYSDRHESEQQKSSAMSEAYNPFCDVEEEKSNPFAGNEKCAQEREEFGKEEEEEKPTNPFEFEENDYEKRRMTPTSRSPKLHNMSSDNSLAKSVPQQQQTRKEVNETNATKHRRQISNTVEQQRMEQQPQQPQQSQQLQPQSYTKEQKIMELQQQRRQKQEEEEDIDSSLVFKMTIKDAIIIDGYDKRDSDLTLYEIAKDRIMRLKAKEGKKPEATKENEKESNATSMNNEGMPTDGSVDDQPAELSMVSKKAPEGWIPKLVQINYYLCEKGTPGLSCFGCGAAFGGLFSSAPRYCEFTGKYFCNKCHSNKKGVVPSHVVWNWDRNLYPINNKSLKFIEDNTKLPMIDLMLNPSLYERVTLLKDLRLTRKKLYYMKNFISSCSALGLKAQARVYLDTVPDYYYNSMDIYSLYDFIHFDEVIDRLIDVVEVWLGHINACFICKNKGSFCEICGDKKPIYPFQLIDVVQCPRCFGVFHKKCYDPEKCPKCIRKEFRDLKD